LLLDTGSWSAAERVPAFSWSSYREH